MGLSELLTLPASVRGSALKEYALFDNRASQALIAASGASIGLAQLALGQGGRALSTLSGIHRAGLLGPVDRSIARRFKAALGSPENGGSTVLRRAVHDFPLTVAPQSNTRRYFDDPGLLLKGNMIVLKSPGPSTPLRAGPSTSLRAGPSAPLGAGPRERGVLYLYYSFINPLFLRFFDAASIARDYYIVLEPSWSGYCDPNILAFTALQSPVFVGALEPRDAAFIEGLGANLETAPFGGNSWVDPRLFHPIAGVEKDIDVVMIAAWAPYKRHWAVFRALQRLKARGGRPRVALVGYALGMSNEEIRAQARHFGVEDLIEIHEGLKPDAVNRLLNRSKVNLLWSRREGVNRAIIEGMFADVPCVVRSGFNYGYEYPYINRHTGRYATEEALPDVLADMIANHASFSPHAWVSQHMSPQVSTRGLQGVIQSVAASLGEEWTRDLVVKVNTLHGLAYWDPADQERFKDDYAALHSRIRSQSV